MGPALRSPDRVGGRRFGVGRCLFIGWRHIVWCSLALALRTSAGAEGPLVCRDAGPFFDAAHSRHDAPALAELRAVGARFEASQRGACFKVLADHYLNRRPYLSEALYRMAVEQLPTNIEALVAAGEHFRSYRGDQGLYRDSHAFYRRALAHLEDTRASTPYQDYLAERVRRGRVELNKRDGLLILDSPGLIGHLGASFRGGGRTLGHNDLATPAGTLFGMDSSFSPGQLLRVVEDVEYGGRARLRVGALPLLEFRYAEARREDVRNLEVVPPDFLDTQERAFILALEERRSAGVLGDLRLRAELARVRRAVDASPREKEGRVAGLAVWTRYFGAVKSDLALSAAFARIELGGESDLEREYAVRAQATYFPPNGLALARAIDPRGFEFTAGWAENEREFGPTVRLKRRTIFGGVELRQLTQRNDLGVLVNWFHNDVQGVGGRDAGNLELNFLWRYRVVDWVNRLRPRQADRALGLAQFTFTARYVEDLSLDGVGRFQSRGIVVGGFAELFIPQGLIGTFLPEFAYELRHYHELGRLAHVARAGIRTGF